jgi:hypothetical protein
MSEHEFSAVYRTPLNRLAELPGELFLEFLANCSPRVKDHLLSKWLGSLAG